MNPKDFLKTYAMVLALAAGIGLSTGFVGGLAGGLVVAHHVGPVVPPGPPTPPAPVDPLPSALQAAYAADPDAAKAQHVKSLAALYRQGATMSNPNVKTNADLLAVLHAAADQLVTPDGLSKVRRAVADYLDKSLGTNAGAAIDTALVAKTFGHVAEVLEGLK